MIDWYQLIDDINKTNKDMIRTKLYADQLIKSGSIACVARMKYKGTIYWAVNGTEKTETTNIGALKKVLKNNVGNNYEIISIKDNQKGEDKTECYLELQNSWKLVKYKDYQTQLGNNNKTETTRLYSCCERKLLSQLENETDKFTMWVALPPCDLCSEAFRYLKESVKNTDYELIVTKFWSYKAYKEFTELGLI